MDRKWNRKYVKRKITLLKSPDPDDDKSDKGFHQNGFSDDSNRWFLPETVIQIVVSVIEISPLNLPKIRTYKNNLNLIILKSFLFKNAIIHIIWNLKKLGKQIVQSTSDPMYAYVPYIGFKSGEKKWRIIIAFLKSNGS